MHLPRLFSRLSTILLRLHLVYFSMVLIFANLTIRMRNFVSPNQPPVVIRYGRFIQAVIYLLIVALVLFFIVKSMTKVREMAAKKKAQQEIAELQEVNEELKVLKEIRDLLAKTSPATNEVQHEHAL